MSSEDKFIDLISDFTWCMIKLTALIGTIIILTHLGLNKLKEFVP